MKQRKINVGNWVDKLLMCVHGVKEGMDAHNCPKCRKLTDKDYGINEPTRVYLKDQLDRDLDVPDTKETKQVN